MSYGQGNALDPRVMGGDPPACQWHADAGQLQYTRNFAGILGRSMWGHRKPSRIMRVQDGLDEYRRDLRMKELQRQMFMQASPQWNRRAIWSVIPRKQGSRRVVVSLAGIYLGCQQGPQTPSTTYRDRGPNCRSPAEAPPGQPSRPAARCFATGPCPHACKQSALCGFCHGDARCAEDDPKLRSTMDAVRPTVADQDRGRQERRCEDRGLINRALQPKGDTATAWGMNAEAPSKTWELVQCLACRVRKPDFTPVRHLYEWTPNTGTIQSMNGPVSLAPGAAGALGGRAAAEAQGARRASVASALTHWGSLRD